MRLHGSARRVQRDTPCHAHASVGPTGLPGLAVCVAAACAVVPAWSAEPASPLAIPASLPSPAPETPALSRPLLRCQVRYASDTVHLETRPTSAPYEVVPHDIAGRFGFKAVVVGTPAAVDHIALYAYDMAVPQAPVLIHEVVYHPPFPVNPTVPGLTGWNHVYSARLGREMVYGCAFTKGTSP